MFEQLITSPIPDAVAPLITLAQNADELAVDAMAIAIGKAERELLIQSPKPPNLEKQLKALQTLKAQNRRIKRTINPPHKEQDDDPFFGAMLANAPIILPGPGGSVTVGLNLDTSATDPDLTPTAFLVISGQVLQLTPTGLSADITIAHSGTPGVFDIQVNDFSYTLPSFDFAGVPSGPTTAALNTAQGPPLGRVQLLPGSSDLGMFDLRLGVELSNDLYGGTGAPAPAIPGFAQVRGQLDFAQGRAVIVAEDPILVPGKPGLLIPIPMFAAPTMAVFDPATSSVRFENMFFDAEAGFDTGEDPEIAFLRFADGSYGTLDNSTDRLLDASVLISDLRIASQTPDLVTFDPSMLIIEDDDGVLLRAALVNITLTTATGDFFAHLDLQDPSFVADAGESPLLQQFLAATEPQLQLLGPQAAGVLYLASEHFTQFGQLTTLDFINGLGVPEPNGAALLLFGALALVGCAAGRSRRQCRYAVNLMPDPF
jgi:hypothetical protein